MKFLTISKQLFLVTCCALFCSFLAKAQVGINTTSPDASSALDISSTDKGLLVTRIELTGTDDLTTIKPSPTTGLLVFNIASAGNPGLEVSPGFYYFNGFSWRRFFTQGFTLTYDQTNEVTANASNITYEILPGLDTGDITVPFSGLYQFKVEGYYAAGDLIDTGSDGGAQGSISIGMSSSNSGTPTPCSGGISSYPYNESFETGLGAWSQSTADDIDWTRNSGTTPSPGTGPSAASDGTFYMYAESSTNNVGFPDMQAILNSPCFDLTAAPAATVRFDYHMFGTDMGTVSLEVSNDNGVSWTSIWSQAGNQGNSWFTQNVDISAYIGTSVLLRFNGTTGTDFRSDFAIDNVSLDLLTSGGSAPILRTLKETYLTTSSKIIGNGGGAAPVNNLAQSATILVNQQLTAGVTYRFAVRGREWLSNNANPGVFGKDTSGYAGNTINDAQRGTMTITLIRQN